MLKNLKDIIKEEYKFIIIMILLLIILNYPVNYYITVGGGISDVSSRIQVEDKYKEKGSFNISYVSELDGNIFTYLLSYIIPSWERDAESNYKYNNDESIDDIEFRSDLDLKSANSTATYWAYTLSDNNIKETSSKIYVIVTYDKYKSNLKVGDEVISIDNNKFNSIKEYQDYIQKSTDKVVLKVKRNGKYKNITCKLYKEDKRNIIGVALQTVKTYKTKPKVNIKFKSTESGPSGGLITTLEIYNQLTKSDLTKGHTIAGTGTIEEDGRIGQIGGIKYKILGAEQGGAEYFLSPSGENYKEATKYKKDHNLKIKIIEVKNIEDAINKLKELK